MTSGVCIDCSAPAAVTLVCDGCWQLYLEQYGEKAWKKLLSRAHEVFGASIDPKSDKPRARHQRAPKPTNPDQASLLGG